MNSNHYTRLALFLCCLLTGAFVAKAQKTVPERPEAAAFRQYLTRHEAARQLGVAQFLQRNALRPGSPTLREYTDAKGAYHFLHHIDKTGKPVYYQTRSNLGLAQSIGTNKLWSGGSLGLNLQGQGMEVSTVRSRLGMWEPGPARTTHVELVGRAITRDAPVFPGKPNGNTDHATHVAGTMMAAGVNPQARGMANQARLDCYEIQTDEFPEMRTAAAEGMLVSNHSYGPDYDTTRVRLGVYDESAQIYDNITFQNKNYLQFHAAGNDRNDGKNITFDILVGSVNAKNVATVGAVNRLGPAGYTGPASVEIADFSSYGPTDDGRIKPDFVAPGVAIFSPYSASDTTYKSIDGTSMASPGAAGSLFLLQQHYRNTKNTFMRAATLKGLGIHTADEAGSSPGPDYMFGWGLLNLEKAIAVINQTGGLHLLEEATLANNDTYRKPVTTGGGPFRTTICWTDVPGTPLVNGGINNRTPMLVNDLDVRLINVATNQTVAQLPWKLNPVNPTAAAGRGDNVVDNVEQIFVDNLPAGQYIVQVTHKGTLQQGPQEFSVFVSSIPPATPIVKVNSTDPSATEGGGGRMARLSAATNAATVSDPGVIRFERSNTAGTLVVNYQIGGSATNGVDYDSLPTSVTFADGQSVLTEEIDPIEDDIVEGDESIIITLVDSDGYDLDPSETTTTVTLRDNDSPGSLTITSFSCNTTSQGLSSVNFVVGYRGGNAGPAVPPIFINGVTANGQLGQTYSFGGFDGNVNALTVQDQASRSTYFVWNFRQACASGATPTPPQPPVTPVPGSLTITSFSCITTNSLLSSVNFVVGYSNGSTSPALPPIFINGVTASGQLGVNYTFTGFDGNVSTLTMQDQASRSTYFVWNFRQACAATSQSRLGAESEAAWQLSVAGNPTSGQIVVYIDGAQGQSLTLELTDVTGRLLAERRILPTQERHQEVFDVPTQTSTMLLLRAIGNQRSQTLKVIKQ